MSNAPLITEVEGFLADSGLAAYRFGILAARNGRLVDRLREGRAVLTTTDERVRQWMRDNAHLRSQAEAGRAA